MLVGVMRSCRLLGFHPQMCAVPHCSAKNLFLINLYVQFYFDICFRLRDIIRIVRAYIIFHYYFHIVTLSFNGHVNGRVNIVNIYCKYSHLHSM